MAQVVSFSAEITPHTNIVAISFGTPYWVAAWREKTGATFPVWLDPDRTAYAAYGLQRSAVASWGPRNLWYYARALARGATLEKTGEDVNQLGGNFIVDRNGIVRAAYPNVSPTERPTAVQLVADLNALK